MKEHSTYLEHEERRSEVFAARNLSYTYRDAPLPSLTDLSFTVGAGEMVGVHGTSGSGKTTLLYTLSGLIPHFYTGGAYGGDLTFHGKHLSDSANFTQTVQEVSYISQNPHEQMFGMTVADVIAFGMENRNIPRSEMLQKIDEVAERVSVGHLLERSVRTLSGGEAQATVIASKLATKPSVLLFDEVISALDPAAAERIRRILHDVQRDGMTILLSDSDTAWASDIAERMILLSGGKMAYDGPPDKFFADPLLCEIAGIGGEERIIFSERRLDAPIAAVDRVTFGYGENPALEDVSLTLPGGSCTVIIGYNGSGKSTLGKLLAGYMEPASGRIQVNDRNVGKLPAAAAVSEVTYLFQRPSQMFSEETVTDEFLLSLRALGKEPAVSLADFGLSGFEDKSPFELSSGQQQRLAQAATFAINPNLLILDEPTRGQSRREREMLVRRIAERSDAGKATVLITHDMQLARRAADTVVVMDHGRVIREDRASAVFTDRELFDQLGFALPGGEQ